MDLIIFRVLASTTFSGGLIIKKQLDLKETIFTCIFIESYRLLIWIWMQCRSSVEQRTHHGRDLKVISSFLFEVKNIDRRPIFVNIYQLIIKEMLIGLYCWFSVIVIVMRWKHVFWMFLERIIECSFEIMSLLNLVLKPYSEQTAGKGK